MLGQILHAVATSRGKGNVLQCGDVSVSLSAWDVAGASPLPGGFHGMSGQASSSILERVWMAEWLAAVHNSTVVKHSAVCKGI